MGELSITTGLREINERLTDAAAIAKASVACDESGSEREALRSPWIWTNCCTRP